MIKVQSDQKKSIHVNMLMLIIIGLLLAIGLVNLFSALDVWGDAGNMGLFWSQIVWIVIGIAFMVFMAFFDYRLIEQAGLGIYVFSLILLVAVIFFGKEVAGQKCWIGIGGFGIQPAEFAKFALVIMLARYFNRHPKTEGVAILGFWKPTLLALIPCALVLVQKDFGGAIFFVLILVTFMWFGRLKGSGIAILVIVGIVSAIVLYFFVFSNYQRARVAAFIDPTLDAKGSGYHMIQARIAVGSGQFFGRGYMQGNINKLKYLPEKHTDFIFPVFAEEWGFAGCLVVLTLYFLLFASGIEIAKKARDRTGLFLAIGVVSFLFWQTAINLGGVLGLMPMTGVTLPFMSYGGSSTIVLLGSLGILLSVSERRFLF